MLPALALVAVVLGGLGTVALTFQALTARDAANARVDTPGTFVSISERRCYTDKPPQCDWDGEFTSDDGTMVRRPLKLAGFAPGSQPNTSVRARYAERDGLYREDDADDSYRDDVHGARDFAVLFGVGLVGGTAWLIRHRRRRRATA